MTPGFSHLSVTGFRRLANVDLRLESLNVLIGANGVGKSSLLDIFDILAASANGKLENAITGRGGMESLLTADGRTNELSIGLRMPQENAAPIDYLTNIVRSGYGYQIALEQLSQTRDPATLPGLAGIHAGVPVPTLYRFIDSTGPRIRYRADIGFAEPDWEYKWLETSLSQVPKIYREAERFRNQLTSVSEIHHALDVSARAPVRLPQTLAPAQKPGRNGEALLSCLFGMRETGRDRFEAVEDALRSAFPAFGGLVFENPSAGHITLGWRDRDLTRPIYANELSEGTLRFLWLVTLLQSPGLPRITLIDEPEVSLHPDMLRLLADLMREASVRTQLIVATHSDRLVRFLTPEELVVCNLDDTGSMSVQRADALELDAWMEEYTLDQLWSMGRLGARP